MIAAQALDALPLGSLAPELALVVALFAILAVDLLAKPALRRAGAWLGIAACFVGCVTASHGVPSPVGSMLSVDALAGLARLLVLPITALVLLAGAGVRRGIDQPGAWSMAVVALGLGASLTAAAANLVSLWLGLELIAMASYTLVAFGGERRAAEAGMKFVLFGGVSSALMIYGMSHVYGLTGRLDFAGVQALLDPGVAPTAALALLLAGVGVAYKLTLVPFHFYAPDVYQGAPPLGIAAVSVLPKIGASAAVLRFLAPGFSASAGNGLAVLAAASALVAGFTALVQRDGKRILAFSGVGHGGAILLALASGPGPAAAAAAGFYLLTYAVGNVGAFMCLSVLERDRGSASLQALAGAWRQRPVVASLLCVFVLSLAGIPPLAGFLGKWGVLQQAFGRAMADGRLSGLGTAALLLLVATVVSAWSYLLLVRAVVFAPALAEAGAVPRVERLATATVVAVGLCLLAVLAGGLWLDGTPTIAAVLAGPR